MNTGSPTSSAPTSAPAVGTSKEEAFMTLVIAMTDTRKRIAILALLSFLAMC
ncbi:MAG: hypothetical protein U0637_07575 [Phycisphaerales bacterium]